MTKQKEYTDWADVPLVLSTPETARLLRVHINSVKNMINDGRLPATKLGRVWKVNKSDIMALLGEQPQD